MPMNTSGFHVQQASTQGASQPQQAWQVRKHFGQAHDGQFGRIEPGIHIGRAHRVAADARELSVRKAFAQCEDQAGAQLVPGRLAGDQRDPHGSGHRVSAAAAARRCR